MSKATLGEAELEQEALEEGISQLKGVYACQVVLDGEGRVQEIHALGTAARSAKQIVRDIESLLRLRFGVSIDYRKISLVQLDALDARQMLLRVQLRSVLVNRTATGHEVTALLRQENQEFVGAAIADETLGSRLVAAGQATLAALELVVDRANLFVLDDIRVFGLGRKEVVAAAIATGFPTGDEVLIGSSVVRDGEDPVDELLAAAARSTLAALNRRLPLLMSLNAKAVGQR